MPAAGPSACFACIRCASALSLFCLGAGDTVRHGVGSRRGELVHGVLADAEDWGHRRDQVQQAAKTAKPQPQMRADGTWAAAAAQFPRVRSCGFCRDGPCRSRAHHRRQNFLYRGTRAMDRTQDVHATFKWVDVAQRQGVPAAPPSTSARGPAWRQAVLLWPSRSALVMPSEVVAKVVAG
jgi:hypothetical protein